MSRRGASSEPTTQGLLELANFGYTANQVTAISDGRNPNEWPTGAKPVTRNMQYDDFGRLVQTQFTHTVAPRKTGNDPFVSPLEHEGTTNPLVVPYKTETVTGTPLNRVNQQNYSYDNQGNTTSTTDDANLFGDRSLGAIVNGTTTSGPNQLQSAGLNAYGAASTANATYDRSGNLTQLAVADLSASHVYAYAWDEIGQLANAQRWDGVLLPSTSGAPEASVSYAYDVGGQRVLRYVGDGTQAQEVNAEIFSTLRLDFTTVQELEQTPWADVYDYVQNTTTETVTLAAGGKVFGRLQYNPSLPSPSGTPLHVFLEAGDHLGSTSIVIDSATSELVERVTYLPFGGVETDYRPDRWSDFREQYKFTGKESDLAMGVTYFGARYYSPMLSRWMSADPMAIHGLGSDLNPYAYVGGNALGAVDSFGLCLSDDSGCDDGGDDPIDWGDGSDGGSSGGTGGGSGGGGGGSGSGGSSYWTPKPVPAPPPPPMPHIASAGQSVRGQTPAGYINMGSTTFTSTGASSSPWWEQVGVPRTDNNMLWNAIDPSGISQGIVQNVETSTDSRRSSTQRTVAALMVGVALLPAIGEEEGVILGPVQTGAEAPAAEGSTALVEGGEVWNDRGGIDFSKSTAFEGQVQIPYTGSRMLDYQAANQAAGLGDSMRAPAGFVWHHLDDYNAVTNTGTMQLVDQAAHMANAPHMGGVAQWVEWMGVPYAP